MEDVRKLRQVQQWSSGCICPNMGVRDSENVLNISRQIQDLGQFGEKGLGNSCIPALNLERFQVFQHNSAGKHLYVLSHGYSL